MSAPAITFIIILVLLSSFTDGFLVSHTGRLKSRLCVEPRSNNEIVRGHLGFVGDVARAGLLAGIAVTSYSRRADAAGTRQTLAGLILPKDCSDSVSVFQDRAGREIVVIGTAHISEESVAVVRRTIQTIQPDTVMIELDPKRVAKVGSDGYSSGRGNRGLADNARARGFILPGDPSGPGNNDNINIINISNSNNDLIDSSDPMSLLPAGSEAQSLSQSSASNANSNGDNLPLQAGSGSFGSEGRGVRAKFPNPVTALMGSMQQAAAGVAGAALKKGLGQFYQSVEKLGFTAGGEFIAAVEEGRAVGAKVLLGDRDVDETLQRLAKALKSSFRSPDDFLRLIERLESAEGALGIEISDNMGKEEITKMVEKLKTKEALGQITAILEQEAPLIYQAMIGERDAFMAKAMSDCSGSKRMVGVVGMAHLPGIERNLQNYGFVMKKRVC